MSTTKFKRGFNKWLLENKYSFEMSDKCIHCKRLKRKFYNPKAIPKYRGKQRVDQVPTIFKNGRKLKFGIDKIYTKYLSECRKKRNSSGTRNKRTRTTSRTTSRTTRKRNNFGGISRKSPRIQTKPSGMNRNSMSRGGYYSPLPGWGKFSSSAGYNRAGNSTGCMDDSRWLFDRQYGNGYNANNNNRNRNKSRYGMRRDLIDSSTNKYFTSRGRTGFDRVPRSIYDYGGGPVPTKSYSPYTGARVGNPLPRPYGPVDNAAMRGYPNYNEDSLFGSRMDHLDHGPFINQGYNSFGIDRLDHGPYINQGYNSFGMNRLEHGPYINQGYNSFGDFRPKYKRTYKPNYNSMANNNLYLKNWNPYVRNNSNNKKKKNFNRKVPSAINRRYSKNFFGNRLGSYNMTGPNNVSNRDPFHMYTPGEIGGNTYNYMTKRQYLPPSFPDRYTRLKVAQNNNPTGYLSNNGVIPVSGLPQKNPKYMQMKRFSYGNKRNKMEKKPWVSYDLQLQRPYPTYQGYSPESSSSVSGVSNIGQPLKLYSYQNNPNVGSYNYPEFSGVRNWYGGFGVSKNKSKKKPYVSKYRTKSTAKVKRKVNHVKSATSKRGRKGKGKVKSKKRSPKAGDTLILKEGGIKIKRK